MRAVIADTDDGRFLLSLHPLSGATLIPRVFASVEAALAARDDFVLSYVSLTSRLPALRGVFVEGDLRAIRDAGKRAAALQLLRDAAAADAAVAEVEAAAAAAPAESAPATAAPSPDKQQPQHRRATGAERLRAELQLDAPPGVWSAAPGAARRSFDGPAAAARAPSPPGVTISERLLTGQLRRRAGAGGDGGDRPAPSSSASPPPPSALRDAPAAVSTAPRGRSATAAGGVSGSRSSSPGSAGSLAPAVGAGSSGYLGVCREGKKWKVAVYHNSAVTRIGRFDTALEAAHAYDAAARQFKGPAARLNFPDEAEESMDGAAAQKPSQQPRSTSRGDSGDRLHFPSSRFQGVRKIFTPSRGYTRWQVSGSERG
jgi:hypothetical protein